MAEKREFVTSLTAQSGRQYKWVHIDELRAFYKANPGKPFHFWAFQDFDEYLEDIDEDEDAEKSQDSFIPDGNLVKRVGQEKTVFENWLDGDEPGPYRTFSNKTFYYLSGQFKMAGDKEYENGYLLQVCAAPLNYLSEDALDSIDVWVRQSDAGERSGKRAKK